MATKGRAATMAQRFGEAFETLAAFRRRQHRRHQRLCDGWWAGMRVGLRLARRRIACASSRAEASVGLLPCAGGTQWLSWTIGESWAKRMVLLGERVDAATALRIGLADELAEKGQGLATALALADKVAKQSPSAVRACKRLIQGARYAGPHGQLPSEREAFVALFDTEDQREGVGAFLSKRAPQWKNG